ncbi:hypothetical protein [Streptomyces sp. NPDC020681]|uniref:hypothetical protein n=1 Tax=Streptomyces sp. NPDC020681 TaxID=3365083 RepID=UPI00378FA6F3
MRSARILIASAAVAAAFTISTPSAYAMTMADDWKKEDSSSSSSSSDHGDSSGKHEKPWGGVHTGGGALGATSADDWQKVDDWEKGSSDSSSEMSGKEKPESWKHEKPKGGVHTGGGGTAMSGSTAAAGTVLLLGGLGAGTYMLRRRGAAGSAAA